VREPALVIGALDGRSPAITPSSSSSRPRRVARIVPDGILDSVEIRVEWIRQRSIEGDADRKNARARPGRGLTARNFNLAAHHLAPARLGGEEDHQEIRVPDLRLDLVRPGLAHGQPLVDEHGTTRLRQTGHDLFGQRLVRLDMTLVAHEYASCSRRRAHHCDCRHDVYSVLRLIVAVA
jgi:hypothetical protein